MIFGDMFGSAGREIDGQDGQQSRHGRGKRLAIAPALTWQFALSLSLSSLSLSSLSGMVLPEASWAAATNAGAGAEGPQVYADDFSGIALSPPEIASPDIIAANRELAAVLPEATPMAIFLSTDEPTWEALNQFELFSKLSAFLGGSLTPRTLPFFPQGLSYEYDGQIQDWMGDQAVIAYLPDTTPRSIEPTDIVGSLYAVVPVANQDELPPFLAAVEAAQVSLEGIEPEKMMYEGVELWVWPTREVALDEYFSPEPLPELPLELPSETPQDITPDPLQELDPSQMPIVPESAAPKVAISKAVDPDVPSELPGLPEDFGGEDPDTYRVPGVTVALMGDHLVFAQEASAVKTLIDYQVLDGPNLAESELFLRSQYSDTDGAIARFYGNLSELVKYNLNGSFPTGSFPEGTFPPNPIPGLPDLSEFPGISLSPDMRAAAAKTLEGVIFDSLIYPQAEGMRIQGRLYGNDLVKSTATPDLPYADSALSFVPAPTYSLSSGRNVAGFWQQLATGLSLSEGTRPFLEQARAVVSSATGLDLDTEVLGWMDQEFVLFFFPSNTGAINSTFPGASIEVGIAVQTSDPTKAQRALDAIDELVGPYIAVDEPVNGFPAVSWQGPAYNDLSSVVSYLSHSWISEDTVLIASGAGAMARLLNATAFEPIDEHPTFVNATDSLAHPNNGYSYLNMGSTLSLIYSQIYRYFGPANEGFFFQQVQSILGTIRGLGSTTSSTDDYWQLDALMNLAPVEGERPSLSILLDVPEADDVSAPLEVLPR
ncbi:MAG: DUF3352 domain-containing protein [Cyanobacteria bacterium J06598_3]